MRYSQILREVADNYLPDGKTSNSFNFGSYSCIAIAKHPKVKTMEHPIFDFLSSLGLDINRCNQFNDFAYGTKRQGARFLWLHFAALVAEDMGK